MCVCVFFYFFFCFFLGGGGGAGRVGVRPEAVGACLVRLWTYGPMVF